MYNEATAEKMIKTIPEETKPEVFRLEDFIQTMKNVKKQLSNNYLKINYDIIIKV
jgi:hypothetical protein